MKVRILPGNFGSYLMSGGSWDDSAPDAASFEVELAGIPQRNAAIVYTTPKGQRQIGSVQEVVYVGKSVYVFVLNTRLLS